MEELENFTDQAIKELHAHLSQHLDRVFLFPKVKETGKCNLPCKEAIF